MKELNLDQMEVVEGGHTSPGQCAAMAVTAVAAGALVGILPGVFAAIGVGIACGMGGIGDELIATSAY